MAAGLLVNSCGPPKRVCKGVHAGDWKADLTGMDGSTVNSGFLPVSSAGYDDSAKFSAVCEDLRLTRADRAVLAE